MDRHQKEAAVWLHGFSVLAETKISPAQLDPGTGDTVESC